MTIKYIWYSEMQRYSFADLFDCSHCGARIEREHENDDNAIILDFGGIYVAPDIYVFCDTDCEERYDGNRFVVEYIALPWESDRE